MSEETYKWATAAEWLIQKAQEKANETPPDTAWLVSSISALATGLDSDKIQDEFQSEMGEDGYFTPVFDRSSLMKLSREEVVNALQNLAGIDCNDDETIETLREALAVNIEDGTIDRADVPRLRVTFFSLEDSSEKIE